MTTQSRDQSLSQSKGDTPTTDAVAKMIGRLAFQLKDGDLNLRDFADVAQVELDKLGAIERELNSLSLSPAPSKEMEEMPAVNSRRPFDDAQPNGYLESLNDWYHNNEEAVRWFLENADAVRFALSLAAELGKEQEAERSGGRVNSSAFWCDNRHVVDYEEAFNIERDLLAQNARLKRELAEARESEKKNVEDWQKEFKHRDQQSAQLIALSAACQRQREALWKAKAKLACGYSESANEILINALLAETPDVSLWQPIESAPKDSKSRLVYCPEYRNTFCVCWHEYEHEPERAGWYVFGSGSPLPYNDAPTLWQPLPPPPTLQPDHQK